MNLNEIESDFLRYLAGNGLKVGDQVPALSKLSEELGISVGKLREQIGRAHV